MSQTVDSNIGTGQEIEDPKAFLQSLSLPDPDDGLVLVVDDETSVADLHEYRVSMKYDTRKAYGGEEALEKMGEDVDVVFLDRRMPDMTGDEVVAEIREEGYDARVVMVTAVDPTSDVVDIQFDDYRTKPVGDTELLDTAAEQMKLRRLDQLETELERVERKIELFDKEHGTTKPDDVADDYELLLDVKAELENVCDELRGEVSA